MKFRSSLLLPILSISLLLPMADAQAGVKNSAHKLCDAAGECISNLYTSAKYQYERLPTFAQTWNVASEKLGLKEHEAKAVINDAKNAVVTYSKAHPYVAFAVVSAAVFGTGFCIAKKFYKPKKA